MHRMEARQNCCTVQVHVSRGCIRARDACQRGPRVSEQNIAAPSCHPGRDRHLRGKLVLYLGLMSLFLPSCCNLSLASIQGSGLRWDPYPFLFWMWPCRDRLLRQVPWKLPGSTWQSGHITTILHIFRPVHFMSSNTHAHEAVRSCVTPFHRLPSYMYVGYELGYCLLLPYTALHQSRPTQNVP